MIVRATLAAACAAVFASSLPSDAIVGGTVVPQGKYPFLVSVQRGGSHICGGSVVAAQWVLTARHCVSGEPDPEIFSVLVGTVQQTSGGQDVDVTAILQHPDEDSDVALLRLARTVSVKPIRLPGAADDAFEKSGVPLVVAGWGATLPVPVDSPDRAQEVTVPAMSDAECARTTQSPGSAADRYVCAGGDALEDSCNGDSGGPLFATPSTGPVLIGVVSYGPIPCGTPTQPGVYAEANNAGISRWIQAAITPAKKRTRR